MTRTRIAVIGLGVISQSTHLPLLRRNADRFEIAALVDLSAERAADMAARYQVAPSRLYGSVDQLALAVESGELALDAAILATTGSHARDTLRLVRAGLSVLAEKPLAYSLLELQELEEFADREGIDLRDRVRVGYMKEYDLASQRARELLADVTLRAVSVEVMHPADQAQLVFTRLAAAPGDVTPQMLAPLLAATRDSVDEAVGASAPAELRRLYTDVVLGSIVHDIGLLRFLVGGLGEVHHAQHWGDRMPGSVHARGTLARQDVPWSIDWHFIEDYPDYRETVTFHHESGTIELVFGVPYVTNLPTVLRVRSRADGLGETVAESRWMQQEAFENELFALDALVRGERPDGPGVAESVEDVAMGQRMIRALAAAQGVVIDPAAEARRK